MRRSCVWQGIVFHRLPSASLVMPMTSWQDGSTVGTMYLWIVRRLVVRASPSVSGDASASVILRCGCAACAGALLK